MIAVQADAKSLEARAGFLEALMRRRRLIERDAPGSTWEKHSSWSNSIPQLRARLRRFDLVIGSTNEGWEAMSLVGRGGCSPALSISMPSLFRESEDEDPMNRVRALMDVARRLSTTEPSPVVDEADGLARAASMTMHPAEASIEVTRPTPWGPGSIRIATLRTDAGFTLSPGRRNENSHKPTRARLDRMLAIAGDRVAEAVSCSWTANDGGGHALVVRPSTASAIWRPADHTAVDNLRLSADWAREMEGSIEP